MDIPKYCFVGDCNNFADKAHIIPRSVLPKEEWDNPDFYTWLCRAHHSLQHLMGINSFCEEYGFSVQLKRAKDAYSSLQ